MGPPHVSSEVSPAISVIVPVYRQWDRVPGLVAALRAQSLPLERFEVLLVDNDPTAPPPGLDLPPLDLPPLDLPPLDLPPLDLPPNARRLPGRTPGSYAARNAGAAVARGGLLAFTDADCRPDPGWLAGLHAAARETPASLLAGPVRVTAGADPSPCAIYDMVRGIPQAAYVARGYAATANLAVPAAVFRALGGFDGGRFSGGDAAFCRRAGRAGHPLRLVAAEVAHPAREDWAGTVRKARRIKGGQIAAGPWTRRAAWTLRSLAPPLRDLAAYARSPHPRRHRRIAMALRLRLWTVELAETVRLVAGGTPERR